MTTRRSRTCACCGDWFELKVGEQRTVCAQGRCLDWALLQATEELPLTALVFRDGIDPMQEQS